MRSLESLANDYTIEQARAIRHASGYATAMILRDSEGNRFLSWSHTGLYYTQPVQIIEEERTCKQSNE